VHAARVGCDLVGQRRDVGFDVRAVDAYIDESFGGGFPRQTRRDNRRREAGDTQTQAE
jgi:hypothetical protein